VNAESEQPRLAALPRKPRKPMDMPARRRRNGATAAAIAMA